MLSTMKRPGERFQLDETLEVVVLELADHEVKLGIRSLTKKPHATPPLAHGSSGGNTGYYYSRDGVTMLVVTRGVGQHLEINDSVDLSIDRLNSNGVRLATTAIDRRPAQPAVVNRLLRWL